MKVISEVRWVCIQYLQQILINTIVTAVCVQTFWYLWHAFTSDTFNFVMAQWVSMKRFCSVMKYCEIGEVLNKP